MDEREICHVCGKEKKPYIVFLDNDIMSYLDYKTDNSYMKTTAQNDIHETALVDL